MIKMNTRDNEFLIFLSESPEDVADELRRLSTQALFLPTEEQESLARHLRGIFAYGEEDELVESATDTTVHEDSIPYIRNARAISAGQIKAQEDKIAKDLREVRDAILAKIANDPETGVKQATCFARNLLGDVLWNDVFEKIAGDPELQKAQNALMEEALEELRKGQSISLESLSRNKDHDAD